MIKGELEIVKYRGIRSHYDLLSIEEKAESTDSSFDHQLP